MNGAISEVLEFHDYSLDAQQREIENLRASLRLADQRIIQQNELNASLEMKVTKIVISTSPG